jgi:diacylglycerol kinase
MKGVIILVVALISVVVLAIHKEQNEQKNCYLQGVPEKSDNINRTLKRLTYCVDATKKTVKWRRSFIVSFIVTVVLYVLVYQRVPQTVEFLLTFLVIYTFFYMAWIHLNNTVDQEISTIAKKNISTLRTALRKN